MKRLLALVCVASCWTAGCSQTPAAQDPAQGLVITNARIVDGNGGVIERGTLVVRDGKIVSVAEGATDAARAQVIDVQGMTVMPGFIDGHRHVIQGDAAQWLTDQAPARMQEFLEAGFTTILSAGDSQDTILELRRRLDSGEITGPRLIVSGRAPLARAGGGGFAAGVDPARSDRSRPPNRPAAPAAAIPDEETRATIRALAEAGVDAVKTNILVSPGGPEQQTLSVIADEARRHGLLTITHAVTVEDTLAAVDAGVDILVHTPHIGQLDEAAARTIAGAGIPMMSTLGVFVPAFDEDNTPLFRDGEPFPMGTLSSAGLGPVNARLLWDAGITLGYGTDTRFPPRDALAHELRPLGLVFSPRDIVTMLTRNAAATVGRRAEIGTLEPGKVADIVIIDGDPLAEISNVLNVEMVIKGGQIVVDNR